VSPPPIPDTSPSSTSCAAQGAEPPSSASPGSRSDAAGSLRLPPCPGAALLGLAYVTCLPLATACAGGSHPLLHALLAAVAGVLALACLRRDLLRQGPGAVRGLRWDAAGRLRLDLADGRRVAVRVSHGSFGTTAFLWLVFRGDGRRTVFIDRAGIDPAAYSALRRLLRRIPTGREPPE